MTAAEDGTGTTTYTYDPDGNQRSVETPTAELTTYSWSYENQLRQIEQPTGDVNTYTHAIVKRDGTEQRVSKDDGVDLIRFVWDADRIANELDEFGALQVRYDFEPAEYGNLISQRQNDETNYHHFDALGSTTELTDPTEVVTDDYRYEAFGQEASHTGATPNPHRWVGQLGYYQDEETSLYSLQQRPYDPATGRFLSVDPVAEDESNLYRYAENDPVDRADPSGQFEQLGGFRSPRNRRRSSRGYRYQGAVVTAGNKAYFGKAIFGPAKPLYEIGTLETTTRRCPEDINVDVKVVSRTVDRKRYFLPLLAGHRDFVKAGLISVDGVAKSSTDAGGRPLLTAADWDLIFKKYGLPSPYAVLTSCQPEIPGTRSRPFDIFEKRTIPGSGQRNPCIIGSSEPAIFSDPVNKELDELEKQKESANLEDAAKILKEVEVCGERVIVLSQKALVLARFYPGIWKSFVKKFGKPGLAKLELAFARGFEKVEFTDQTSLLLGIKQTSTDFKITGDTIEVNSHGWRRGSSEGASGCSGVPYLAKQAGKQKVLSCDEIANNLNAALNSDRVSSAGKRSAKELQASDRPGSPGVFRFSQAMWLKDDFLKYVGDGIKEQVAWSAATAGFGAFVTLKRLGDVGEDVRSAAKARTARRTRQSQRTHAPRAATTQAVRTPWGRQVRQRSDIDWDFVRPKGTPLAGQTNRAAAQQGYTPVRINPQTGKVDDVVLHHALDDPRGTVIETWRSSHTRFHQTIGREPNPWRQQRPDWAQAWQREQSAYWAWRTGARSNIPVRDSLWLPGDPR